MSFLALCSLAVGRYGQQNEARLLFSETDGATGKEGFEQIKNQKQLRDVIKSNYPYKTPGGKDDYLEKSIPDFPKNAKVFLYRFPQQRSGSLKVEKITNAYVQDETLYIGVSRKRSEGQMQMQVISNPWMVFSVPEKYNFHKIIVTSVVTKDGKIISKK